VAFVELLLENLSRMEEWEDLLGVSVIATSRGGSRGNRSPGRACARWPS